MARASTEYIHEHNRVLKACLLEMAVKMTSSIHDSTSIFVLST